MSASLAHPKLDALPALDMESDRLARACGQGLSFSTRSSLAQAQEDADMSSWPMLPRASERTGEASSSMLQGTPPQWEYPDFSGSGFGSGSAQTRGMRPRPHSVRVPTRVSPAAPVPHRPRSFSQPAAIPVFSPPTPRSVLRSLQAVLEQENTQLGDCLDVQPVLERWAIHRRLSSGLGPEGVEGVSEKTFGAPVSMAVKCASMSTVLGGYQHPIPWVVYACIEELNRTGIYQPGLFRAVPHRSRLETLIAGFDCHVPSSNGSPSPSDLETLCPPCMPTASITRASLRKESMADICALFKSYMGSVPEPLLDENITRALHRLCVVPSDMREEQKAGDQKKHGYRESGGYFFMPSPIAHALPASPAHLRTRSDPVSPTSLAPLLMTPSERRSVDMSLELSQIKIAQHLLRLSTPPLCSLFAYLCAFFTQLPLSPDNGITLEDVSRMFGRALAGGPLPMRHAVLMWLLERWPRVADGLFNICPAESDDSGDHPASAYPAISPAKTPNLDVTAQPQPDVISPTYSISDASIMEARRGSVISLDGAESVFTTSTVESEGSHGIRTPFSTEFAPLPLPAVREYEFEPEWEESQPMHPLLDGSAAEDLVGHPCARIHSPGTSSQAIFVFGESFLDPFIRDPAADPHDSLDDAFVPNASNLKRPANSRGSSNGARSASPGSPPPESDYESASASVIPSRSASRASGVSDGTTKYAPVSPASGIRMLDFRFPDTSPRGLSGVRMLPGRDRDPAPDRDVES